MGGCRKIVDIESLDSEAKELIEEAKLARSNSYAPYSKFQVGAALRCSDGTISRGCNVENVSYSVSICAERTAIVKAISEGKRTFSALGVVASNNVADSFVTPCGLCRQTLVEFGDIPVYIARPEARQVFITSVNDLLPFPFKEF